MSTATVSGNFPGSQAEDELQQVYVGKFSYAFPRFSMIS